jgi:reactive chlorine resistance protein C
VGVFELADAVLLATKPLAPKLSIAGSVLAIVLFVSTVSFLFTTPVSASRPVADSQRCP